MALDIDKMTVGELKEVARTIGITVGASGLAASAQNMAKPVKFKSHSMHAGESVLIRTVTFYYTGKIIAITASDIVLSEAAWIPDTGRYADALKTGKLNEVEPFPDSVIIPRGGIIDIAPWAHALPREQK